MPPLADHDELLSCYFSSILIQILYSDSPTPAFPSLSSVNLPRSVEVHWSCRKLEEELGEQFQSISTLLIDELRGKQFFRGRKRREG